jgi:hypothetical protein
MAQLAQQKHAAIQNYMALADLHQQAAIDPNLI